MLEVGVRDGYNALVERSDRLKSGDRQVERVRVSLARRTLVFHGRNDSLAVGRVCDAYLAAAKSEVEALGLCTE